MEKNSRQARPRSIPELDNEGSDGFTCTHASVYEFQNQMEDDLPYPGVPTVAEHRQIRLVPTRMRAQSLASLSGSGIWHCCELWCRSQTHLDLALLWLWHRPAAVAPIRPLAWELPYPAGAALKKKKKKR